MAELVLGVGHQKSIRDIVTIAEREIRVRHGPPRKIFGQTEHCEFTAKRTDFEGDFETFTIRVHVPEAIAQNLQKVAEEFSDACLHESEEKNWHIFRLPLPDSTDYDVARQGVDKLSAQLNLPEVWRVSAEGYRTERISIELLFQAMMQYKASDVHLAPGEPPIFRIDNQTRPSELMGPLSAAQLLATIKEISPKEDFDEFEKTKQSSFSFHQVGMGYSRVSCFVKSGSPHITMRFLPEEIPTFTDLNVPADTMTNLAQLHRGLLLVTGMTGSGKTTTSAALIDWINQHRMAHILTIESPIEYVHRNKKSIISQRSLGIDVMSFSEGVRGALRHDPDVIVIGEMRDPDTIRSAISAAATGHLVISTLHANSASEVVNRIVSFFDPVERDLVKLQLRDCLKCIICQRLVPRVGGGRVPALEVMFNDLKAIADGIIAGDTDNIRVGMQQSASASFLFEKYLFNLYKQGKITLDTAREYATEVSVLDQMQMGTYSIPRLESIKGHH